MLALSLSTAREFSLKVKLAKFRISVFFFYDLDKASMRAYFYVSYRLVILLEVNGLLLGNHPVSVLHTHYRFSLDAVLRTYALVDICLSQNRATGFVIDSTVAFLRLILD